MNRIQLTFSRNKEDETFAYRVFRSIAADVSHRDTLVMEIEHPPLPEPVFIKEDKLKRDSMYAYYATHGAIMPASAEYPIQVYLNGVDIALMGISYSIDYISGMFQFSAGLNESDEVLASYSIDGLQVLDTDEIDPAEGTKYFGPPARDRTEPTVPENLSLLPDPARGRIILTWADASAPGQTYYYRVEAVDAYGNFSNFSQERSVHLREFGDSGIGYYVERSFDNINWEVVSKQNSLEYIEYGVDQEPPGPATNLAAAISLNHGRSTANVTLTWGLPDNNGASTSARYRVRSVSTIGVPSLPSAVIGPVYLPYGIEKYVVRRKVADGSIPSYNGLDAITVAELPAGDSLNVWDPEVVDNTTYAYAVYVVNRVGVHSIAANVTAGVGDATPPNFQAAGLKASNYSYLI